MPGIFTLAAFSAQSVLQSLCKHASRPIDPDPPGPRLASGYSFAARKRCGMHVLRGNHTAFLSFHLCSQGGAVLGDAMVGLPEQKSAL